MKPNTVLTAAEREACARICDDLGICYAGQNKPNEEKPQPTSACDLEDDLYAPAFEGGPVPKI